MHKANMHLQQYGHRALLVSYAALSSIPWHYNSPTEIGVELQPTDKSRHRPIGVQNLHSAGMTC